MSIWKKYKKLRQLGEGGMGEVWLVADKETRMLCAVKLIRKEFLRGKDVRRFERELQILGSLEHDNIVKVYEIDLDDPAYAMEYCPDGDIEQYRSIGASLDRAKVLSQLVSAVKYLHEQGFIHRDIKPQNILIAPDGSVRLGDFGLAVKTAPGRTVITTSIWVSAGFAAPEQFRNTAAVTETADIYSVGAVYYWLATGRIFDVDAAREPQLQPLDDFDRAVVERTLQRDVSARAGSIDELLGMVRDYEEHNLGDCFAMPPARRLDFLRRRYAQFVEAEELETGRKTEWLRDMRGSIRAALRYERDSEVRALAEQYLTELAGLIDEQKRLDELEFPGMHDRDRD